jgi:hypothetical protein
LVAAGVLKEDFLLGFNSPFMPIDAKIYRIRCGLVNSTIDLSNKIMQVREKQYFTPSAD